MDQLKCGVPPRRFTQGGRQWVETCNMPAHTWNASKGGHTEQLVRCNEHAAQLRAKGFDVRIADKPLGKRKWDLTSTNSLEAAAGYLRKNSGAVMVLVVRAADAVVAVDDGIAPNDIPTILQCCLREAMERLEQQHAKRRGVNQEPNPEGSHV